MCVSAAAAADGAAERTEFFRSFSFVSCFGVCSPYVRRPLIKSHLLPALNVPPNAWSGRPDCMQRDRPVQRSIRRHSLLASTRIQSLLNIFPLAVVRLCATRKSFVLSGSALDSVLAATGRQSFGRSSFAEFNCELSGGCTRRRGAFFTFLVRCDLSPFAAHRARVLASARTQRRLGATLDVFTIRVPKAEIECNKM